MAYLSVVHVVRRDGGRRERRGGEGAGDDDGLARLEHVVAGRDEHVGPAHRHVLLRRPAAAAAAASAAAAAAAAASSAAAAGAAVAAVREGVDVALRHKDALGLDDAIRTRREMAWLTSRASCSARRRTSWVRCSVWCEA